MKKTLLSIMAAAGIIASSAVLADSSLVEVYGTLNVDFENVKATGGTAAQVLPAGQLGTAPSGVVQPSRNRVTSNSSNIGFRGKEDLGMGWNAIFQVESGLAIDSASTVAVTSTQSSGFWATRNSNLGLSSSKYGTVFYGNWDTPYKSLTNIATFDPFWGTGIASDNAVIGVPGFNVATTTAGGRAVAAGDASFDRRQGNSVHYWTPQFFGALNAKFAYSANEGRANEPTPATGNVSPTIYSASVRYEYGPFVAAYAWEQHRDYFGLTQLGVAGVGGAASSLTNQTARDNGNKVTLSYKFFGTTTANVAWERLSYNNSDTVTGDLINYRRDLIYVSLLHQMGAGTFRLGFGDARQGSCDRAGGTAACSTIGLDARQYAFGYSYSLSKRTDLYALWTRVNNGQFATYQLGNGAGLAAAAGNHSQGFGLGMRHYF